VKPAIGVGSWDVDVFGGDNEDGAPGDVGERVDFFAAAYAEGATAEEKEGHVGAQGGGQLDQGLLLDAGTGQAQIADQSGSGIAGATTKTAACWDFLVKGDFDAVAEFGAEFGAKGFNGAVDEIFFDRFGGERFVAKGGEGDGGLFGGAEMQGVVEGDGLEDGAKFVIAVSAFAEDVETEINFGEGGNFDLAHREVGRVAEVLPQEKDNAETQRTRRFAEKKNLASDAKRAPKLF
jgi:hypothetical protein